MIKLYSNDIGCINTKEAASILGEKPNTMLKRIETHPGLAQEFKLGRDWYFPVEHIRWMADNRPLWDNRYKETKS